MVSEEPPVGCGCCPLGRCPATSRPCSVKNASFQTPCPRPSRSHVQPTRCLTPHPVLLGCPAQRPCPRSPWGFAQNPRAGCMQWPRRALLPGRRPRPLPSRSWDRAGSRPSTHTKVTNEGHKSKWRRATGLEEEEGRGSPGGRGGHPVNARGLGRGEWGVGWGEGRGDHGGDPGEEKAVMQCGTDLLLLYQILSQSIGVG